MSYTISININLKNNMNNESTKNLLIESGLNLNLINYYFDYELEGINNHIKKNNEIIIIEFEELTNIIDYINFIINIDNISIEYVYDNNNILYGSKKYLNSLKDNNQDKKKLLEIIDNNKNKIEYNKLYKSLKV
jgi:methionine synthase II (cobalamin-independent)|tara:strand:- start:1197 stop:1598 length:402 start_codon:yes stop_codon:yes gene_type:complete